MLCAGICISSSEMASSFRNRFTTVTCCNCVSYKKAPTNTEARPSVDALSAQEKYNVMMNVESEETSKAKAQNRRVEFEDSVRPIIKRKVEQRYSKRGQVEAGEDSVELLSPQQRSSAARVTVNKSGASSATAPLPDYDEATRLYPNLPNPTK